MKAVISTQVSIDASRAAVFKYLADLKYHYLWNPQIQTFSTTEPLRLGSKYTTESLVLGVKIRATNVIKKFAPPVELEMENKTGTVRYRANFTLSKDDKKTLVVCSTTISTDSKSFAFTIPILKKLGRRELQTDMQALKIAVENQLQ